MFDAVHSRVMGLMSSRRPLFQHGNVLLAEPTSSIIVDIGMNFGRLSVCAEDEPYLWRGRFSRRRWICKCECGKLTSVREDMLKNGRTSSCGCFRNDQTADRFTLHGGKRSTMRLPEYQAWQTLLHRNSSESICANWCLPNGEGFSNFFRDIGKRPTPKHRLVRVNAKEPFSPANCLWSDQIPRRGVPRRSIRISNVEMTLREAAAQFGVPYAVLCRRLQRGWCAERAVQPLLVA
jgi:hypothetical protein